MIHLGYCCLRKKSYCNKLGSLWERMWIDGSWGGFLEDSVVVNRGGSSQSGDGVFL